MPCGFGNNVYNLPLDKSNKTRDEIERCFMLEQQYGFHEGMGYRSVLGLLLLIAGAGIAIWVFVNVYQVYNAPSKLARFQWLAPEGLGATMKYEGKEVEFKIPEEFLVYGLPIGLLLISGGIASILLRAGVRLLNSDLRRKSKRHGIFKNRLNAKIDDLQQDMGGNG